MDPAGSKIIFTSTCRSCEELSLMLTDLEIPNVSLHSQVSMERRGHTILFI